MPLRSGKKYLKIIFPIENQPFKLILLPEKKIENQPFKLILLPEKKIDFDQSSKEWRKNKYYHGNGTFTYK